MRPVVWTYWVALFRGPREQAYPLCAVSGYACAITQQVPQVGLCFRVALLRRFRQPLKGSGVVLGNSLSMQVEIRQIVFPLGQPSLCCQSKPLCSSSLVCGHTVADKGHSPKRSEEHTPALHPPL